MPGENQVTNRLSGAPSLTDIMIQIEDFLDGLDLYVFKNWFDGEIVDGPIVRRYWVGITLQYDYENMPDPAGGERLLTRGCKVYFYKAKQEVAVEIESQSDYREDGRRAKPKLEEKDIWLVEIQIPRRFIADLDDEDLAMAEDAGIDGELVSDARDENIDDEAAFTVDDSAEEETGTEDEEQAE